MLGNVVISFQHNCKEAKALKLEMCYNSQFHCYSHGNHHGSKYPPLIHGDFQLLHAFFFKSCKPSHFPEILFITEQTNQQ